MSDGVVEFFGAVVEFVGYDFDRTDGYLRVKNTGEVRLDDDRLGQMGFRTRPNHQIWPVVWPQGVICSGNIGNCVLSEWI